MDIGRTIRARRKQAGLTQEEVANRLGVTTPAVSKWENGGSLPDVMLLAPLARLLDMTIDELLGFDAALSDEEVNGFVRELDQCLRTEGFEKAFQRAKKKIETYPNCGKLIWQAAVVLDGWRAMHDQEDWSAYDGAIEQYYQRLLEDDDEKVRAAGAEALYHAAMRTGDFPMAQRCLDHLPQQDPERARRQAALDAKTGRREEAYRAYEELLLKGFLHIRAVMDGLSGLYLDDGDQDSARMMSIRQGRLAALFDMGEYNEVSPMLEMSVRTQNVEETERIMRALLDSVETLTSFRHSMLYRHMQTKEPDDSYFPSVRGDLLASFRDEEDFAYMRGNAWWEALRAGGGH